ncbi:MAG: hypothetical protein M1829_006804 [Trizodia sp. TS-e1964]|nr:MAG: hypothetical protein M1829_006804 [Trizodia sp. TS-e1964]
METLQKELDSLISKNNLSLVNGDVQQTLDLLLNARDSIREDPNSAAITMAKLQNPFKQSFDKVNDSLKVINKGLNRYEKALDKMFKPMPFPSSDYDALAAHPTLINRALAMHFLREGQFKVASTFIDEILSSPPRPRGSSGFGNNMEMDLDIDTLNSKGLQIEFTLMYEILHAMRTEKNLLPAIAWAREHAPELESRGSNLEFELVRLQYVWLFLGTEDAPNRGLLSALNYGRSEFPRFQNRYLREVQQLTGALAYRSNIEDSPYTRIFINPLAWEEIAKNFAREFCSLLGLSADSPLHIAVNAGAIALPTLIKLENIIKTKGAEWTTQDELPVSSV